MYKKVWDKELKRVVLLDSENKDVVGKQETTAEIEMMNHIISLLEELKDFFMK